MRYGPFLGLLSLFGVAGCGGAELPPQLPTSETRQRAATRVELVDFVIADRTRAEKVRALYVEVDDLMLRTKRLQAAELLALAEGPRNASETQALVGRFRQAEQAALERYVNIQLEIRGLTTPAEFARLDAIK